MDQRQCCRTCLAELDLSPIFPSPEHHDKYCQVILEATGVDIVLNDSLPQQMCSACIGSVNSCYRFRKKCQETQNILTERFTQNNIMKIERVFVQPDKHSIDISDLLEETAVNNVDDVTYDDDTNIVMIKDSTQEIGTEDEKCKIIEEKVEKNERKRKCKEKENSTQTTEKVEVNHKKRKCKEPVKRTPRPRKSKEKPKEAEKEGEVIEIVLNDSLPQQMCSACIGSVNSCYRFRKKCQETQNILTERFTQNNIMKIERVFVQPDKHSIDISDLLEETAVNNVDDVTYDDDTNIVMIKDSTQEIGTEDEKCKIIEEKVEKNERKRKCKEKENSTQTTEKVEVNHKKRKCKEPVKRTPRPRKSKEKPKEAEKEGEVIEVTAAAVKEATDGSAPQAKDTEEKKKEAIECEYCHKVLTSRLSLRNHYKIHTGFDVVCEHCGKKFITRRLLLMHCKAKHGYEKTDQCNYCDYRASNREQVKIHERLHTGERPYTCGACGAAFHRRSSMLQHAASHLTEKTVPCVQCSARFKSVTLMRIHLSRHRAPAHHYACGLCALRSPRRRNVARHLARAHGVSDLSLIRRTRPAP